MKHLLYGGIMDFFESGFWNRVRANKKLYGLIHNTIGLWIKNYGLRERIGEMKADGLSTIFEIDKLLSQKNAVFFVDFGTLLGFVRNRKPLSWDYDIDFGICFNDLFQWEDLGKAMKTSGFQLEKQFTYNGTITEQTFRRNNIYIDFFSHFIDDDSSYYYVYYAEKDYPYKDKSQLHARITRTVIITGTKEFEVDGGYIHVPVEYESYLADVYGENWRIPNPNWVFELKPNVTKMNGFGVLEEFNNNEK